MILIAKAAVEAQVATQRGPRERKLLLSVPWDGTIVIMAAPGIAGHNLHPHYEVQAARVYIEGAVGRRAAILGR